MPDVTNKSVPGHPNSTGEIKPGESIVIDAANHHIGPTLEAEGNFTDVMGTALPAGGGVQGDIAPDSVEVRHFGQDLSAVDSDDPTLSATTAPQDEGGSGTEALRTRLPGDTSSDPHTDEGSDNATTAHAHIDEDRPPTRRAS